MLYFSIFHKIFVLIGIPHIHIWLNESCFKKSHSAHVLSHFKGEHLIKHKSMYEIYFGFLDPRYTKNYFKSIIKFILYFSKVTKNGEILETEYNSTLSYINYPC